MRSSSRSTFGLARLAILAKVAVVFALFAALPVSQLRLITVIIECCCPDPDHCNCPEHPTSNGSHSTMLPCHKSVETLESASAPSFAPDLVVVELVPARALVAIHHTHATPHEPPSLERPSAPS
jgi:hypothetical protein